MSNRRELHFRLPGANSSGNRRPFSSESEYAVSFLPSFGFLNTLTRPSHVRGVRGVRWLAGMQMSRGLAVIFPSVLGARLLATRWGDSVAVAAGCLLSRLICCYNINHVVRSNNGV